MNRDVSPSPPQELEELEEDAESSSSGSEDEDEDEKKKKKQDDHRPSHRPDPPPFGVIIDVPVRHASTVYSTSQVRRWCRQHPFAALQLWTTLNVMTDTTRGSVGLWGFNMRRNGHGKTAMVILHRTLMRNAAQQCYRAMHPARGSKKSPIPSVEEEQGAWQAIQYPASFKEFSRLQIVTGIRMYSARDEAIKGHVAIPAQWMRHFITLTIHLAWNLPQLEAEVGQACFQTDPEKIRLRHMEERLESFCQWLQPRAHEDEVKAAFPLRHRSVLRQLSGFSIEHNVRTPRHVVGDGGRTVLRLDPSGQVIQRMKPRVAITPKDKTPSLGVRWNRVQVKRWNTWLSVLRPDIRTKTSRHWTSVYNMPDQLRAIKVDIPVKDQEPIVLQVDKSRWFMPTKDQYPKRQATQIVRQVMADLNMEFLTNAQTHNNDIRELQTQAMRMVWEDWATPSDVRRFIEQGMRQRDQRHVDHFLSKLAIPRVKRRKV